MQTILITGASRGIGLATAQKFLEAGWRVIGTSTSGKSSLGGSANFDCFQLDITDSAQITEFVANLVAQNIKLDVVVNNAGTLVEPDEDDTGVVDMNYLKQTLQVNLIGTIELTEGLLKANLIAEAGHIINVSSQMAGISEPAGYHMPAYRISKTALNAFTHTLAQRLAKIGTKVSSLDPGWVKTDMGGDDAPRDPSEPASEIYGLATDQAAPTGKFWRMGKVRDW